ncbi:hypothetical protein LIER_35363 [Lithospermum erythrorhizon]|uniref:Uncharacterized protein n=1 Tax=Lithospermum erythrorhizon TaxID=34254 RepID=A0AAV3NS15_LITER
MNICTTKQGTDYVIVYYNKLKRLWDELVCIKPNAFYGSDSEERVMQFLMGLNEEYDHIRSQILLMDPIPTVSKSYSIVINVEKQRQVNLLNIPVENSALQVNVVNHQNAMSDHITQFQGEDHVMQGHVKSGCFKIIGYPAKRPPNPRENSNVQKGRYLTHSEVYQDTPLKAGESTRKHGDL